MDNYGALLLTEVCCITTMKCVFVDLGALI